MPQRIFVVMDQHTVDDELFQATIDALCAAGNRTTLKGILAFVATEAHSNTVKLSIPTNGTGRDIMRSIKFVATDDDSEVFFKAFAQGYLRNDIMASLNNEYKSIKESGGPLVSAFFGNSIEPKVIWVGKRFEGWIHTQDDLEAAFGIIKIPPAGGGVQGAPGAPVPGQPPVPPGGANLAGLFGALMSNPAIQNGIANAFTQPSPKQ